MKLLPVPKRSCLLTAMLIGTSGLVQAASEQEMMRLLPLSLEELINLPVVTASRRSELRDHTPAHVLVITAEQIRTRRYLNLADLLEDLPGVDFMRGTKSSSYNNFSVQGYNSNNKLLIMQDGVRIDHPAGGKIPVAENFPLFHAHQVEVVYGPAAALYGADAVAGVINIISKAPGEHQGAWVSTSRGRFDTETLAFMAAAGQPERFAISVAGHRHHSDRAPLDRYYPQDFPRVDATTFAGEVIVPAAEREPYAGTIASHNALVRLDIGDHLSLGHQRNFFRQLTSTGDRPDTALFSPAARWETLTETSYAKLRFGSGPDLRAELVLDHAQLEVNPRSQYLNIFTNFDAHGHDYVKARRTGIEQSLHWQAHRDHSVQAGLGYQDFYALETPDLPEPYDRALGPDGQNLFYQNTNLPIGIFDARYHNLYGFAQLQSDWNTRLSTMIGVRHDRHSAYGNSTNPRLGVVFRPAPQHVLKALYGEAFRAPSPEESLSAFGSFSGEQDGDGNYIGSGFRVPNSALQPETAKTLSLTWDWRPRNDINLVANLYHSRIRNLIVTLDETVPTQYIPGAILSRTTIKGNAGEEKHTGLDLIGQWQFDLGTRWRGDLWGSLSFVDGRIREGMETQDWALSYVARRKLKLGVTFRYLDQFTITPRMQWNDDTSTGRKDRNQPGERIRTPGAAVFGLHLGWHGLFNKRATLWLDIDNLFDKRYYAAHGSASTTFVDMPQQPRRWMATFEYRF